MTKIFEDIKTGLNEAIEYENGNFKVKTTTESIKLVDLYNSNEIKSKIIP